MRNRKLNIYKRKDGRYEGRAYLAGGKYKSVYGKNEKEAAEKLLEFLNEQTVSKVRCKRYFNDLLDEWLCSLNIKESSVYCYKTKIENHIHPYFSGVKYENVDEMTMQDLMRKLLNKHLSSKYITDIISIVKSFAKWAWKKYHYENRISEVSTPKIVHNKTTLLSAEKQRKLCDYVKNHPDIFNIGIYITMNTGIRSVYHSLSAYLYNPISTVFLNLLSDSPIYISLISGGRCSAIQNTTNSLISKIRSGSLRIFFIVSGDNPVISASRGIDTLWLFISSTVNSLVHADSVSKRAVDRHGVVGVLNRQKVCVSGGKSDGNG